MTVCPVGRDSAGIRGAVVAAEPGDTTGWSSSISSRNGQHDEVSGTRRNKGGIPDALFQRVAIECQCCYSGLRGLDSPKAPTDGGNHTEPRLFESPKHHG